jgi:phenylalanyl-tRNA synthetase beta chain
MPQSTLSLERINALLPQALSEEGLRETLFRSKVEPGSRMGDRLTVEVTPDRLDLLDEAGLARDLAGLLGFARGMGYAFESAALPGVEARQNASVSPLRGAFAAVALEAPAERPLDAGLLDEAIRFQELLHATTGRDRRAGSLGLYPLERLTPPFRYTMEPLGQIRFTPLSSTEEMDGKDFYQTHPMALRYGNLGRQGELALTLRDDEDRILSLPPVLNSADTGEVRPGDRRILVEATGTRPARVRELIGYMILPFVERGWKAHPVPIHGPDGSRDGVEGLRPRRFTLSGVGVQRLLGVRLSASETAEHLQRARLSAEVREGRVQVEAPPWRSDLLSEADLVEEVAVALGYGHLKPILPPSPTRGSHSPSARREAQLREVALGMGFQELFTPVLVSGTAAGWGLALSEPLGLVNPVSSEFSHVRSSLLPGLLTALARNTRYAYPQRVFELGPVVLRDPEAGTGTRTDRHLALVEAGPGAGFARAAAWSERFLTLLGLIAGREPLEVPGTIAGRCAQIKVAGEGVLWMGEVHPRILAELHLPEPVAFLVVHGTRLERLRPLPAAAPGA